ncbi:MAG: DUF898 family protein [Thalassobaculum sp.]|uniref:DUF898 family protein n=1 Tax=Thalassobaculum sp. TaxID=2022740 RepID=UPI0032F06C1E
MTEQPTGPAGGGRSDSLRAWSATRTPGAKPRLAYDSPGYLALLKLHVVNTLLTVVTLSVWRFWAVTRVRRLLWAHIRFDDQPLEYTGNGLEIFVGFLKVVLFVLLPIGLAMAGLQLVLADAAPSLPGTLSIMYFLGLLWLIALGKYLSFRYRVSRTRWRGIRGRLSGSAGGYFWLAFWTFAVTVLTVGLFKPWMDADRIHYALNGARAGSLRATTGITGGTLFPPFLLALLLVPIAIGILFVGSSVSPAVSIVAGPLIPIAAMAGYFWYRAALFRLTAERTQVGPLLFDFTASGWAHAWLWIGNMLLLFGPAALVGIVTLPFLFVSIAAMAAGGATPDAAQLQAVLALSNLPIYGTLGLCYLLLMPVVWQRRIRFVCRHLAVHGAVDPAVVRQAAEDPSVAGEGLVGDFDAF